MSTTVSTLSGGTAQFDDERLAELRATFRGRVITPGDEGYDEGRDAHNALFDRRPGMIVECTGTADVIDAVRLAADEGLLLAVRGGGHSIAGHSTSDGGLLVDLAAMSGVWVDPTTGMVSAQGGATWGDVDREAQAFGLAVPGGIISTTGVGGLTLGGGIGWLHRKHGLACDSLRAVHLVTADGCLVRASADTNPDLFWALRGGGGNFGVVTSFEFEGVPVGPMVFQAAVVYPLADAAEILPKWVEWTRAADDEATSRALLWTLPDVEALPPPVRGADCLILAAIYAGSAEDGEQALAPLRAMGQPLADLSGTLPYRMAQAGFDPFFAKGAMRSYWKSMYLDDIGADTIALVLARAADRPHPLTLIHIPHMGGATGRVAADATAFGDRSASYMLSVDGNWTDPADDESAIAWTRSFIAAASAIPSARGIYLNFSGDEDIDASARDAAFGANLRRLTEVKNRYDPANMFRLNNNVPPTREAEVPAQRPADEEPAVQES
ncbi:MAG: FAD-binding oxidoreductase [Actinomycetes bacterium]